MNRFSLMMNLTRKQPVYRQIESRIKQAITAGEFPFGTRLRTDRDLAIQYETSVFTIQKALAPLAGAGLIERTRRRGTCVINRCSQLRQVGIYFGGNFLHFREMAFHRELQRKLTSELESREVRHSLWVDGRLRLEQTEPLPELAEAVAAGAMQGLIVGSAHAAEMRWLTKLNIPLSLCGTAPVPYRVGFDSDQMVELAIQEFKRQRCRSVGAIIPLSASVHRPLQTETPENIRKFFRSFVNRVADAQLETRNSWVRIPHRLLSSSEHENFGYRQFLEIWKQPHRPEGLLVFPDTVVRGCVIAMLQCGVSALADIKLILHRNKGIPVLCPIPASWLVADVGQVAASLIRQIDLQLAGQPAEPLFVPLSRSKQCRPNHNSSS